jgi:hypothetical protein
MMDIRERYLSDPEFHALVDMMRKQLESAQFTPTEIREAAMLAQIMYEQNHPRPIVMTRPGANLPERNPRKDV